MASSHIKLINRIECIRLMVEIRNAETANWWWGWFDNGIGRKIKCEDEEKRERIKRHIPFETLHPQHLLFNRSKYVRIVCLLVAWFLLFFFYFFLAFISTGLNTSCCSIANSSIYKTTNDSCRIKRSGSKCNTSFFFLLFFADASILFRSQIMFIAYALPPSVGNPIYFASTKFK